MHTFDFIFHSADAKAGRLARHISNCSPAEVAAGAGHENVVVTFRKGEEWQELDARSLDHALRLAETWMLQSLAIDEAQIHTVDPDGALGIRLKVFIRGNVSETISR